MKLILVPAAIKELSRLPAKDTRALMEKLKAVAQNPKGDYPWALRLTNHPGFRIRHGDWRAIYRLDFETDEMIVDRIAKREEAYR
ncbi:MAG: type II toxin-antitoxin system RelE/ParE family toxin [Rhodospirillales bacterium]|jgi:mRNA interferase RelE/StbE